MTLYALDDIDDAIDATRTFLWPFDRGRWVRLAVVVFFLGGASGFNPFQFTGNAPQGPGTPGSGPGGMEQVPDVLPSIGGAELAVVAGIVALIVLIALGFLFVGSVMEFVFVESLRREDVTVRRYWRDHWRRGVRLFGFRALLGVLTLAVVGALIVVVLSPLLFGSGGFSLAFLALAIPVFVVMAVASGLVNGFTTMFVVPVMLVEDRALLSAWRRFWPTMTGRWKQYAAYAVGGFVLQLAAGLVAGIVTVLAALVIAIPVGIVALVGVGLLSVVEIVGLAVIALAAVVFGLAMVAIALLVAVPVQTFLRYYALFVLGDTNEAFDLIPERRRAVRE